jgi:hypothetical protein
VKSGGQIDGQMSSQSLVVWWYREVNCEDVGMCVDAGPLLAVAVKISITKLREPLYTFSRGTIALSHYHCITRTAVQIAALVPGIMDISSYLHLQCRKIRQA